MLDIFWVFVTLVKIVRLNNIFQIFFTKTDGLGQFIRLSIYQKKVEREKKITKRRFYQHILGGICIFFSLASSCQCRYSYISDVRKFV